MVGKPVSAGMGRGLDANRAVAFLRAKMALIVEHSYSEDRERAATQMAFLLEKIIDYSDLTLAQLRELDREMAEISMGAHVHPSDEADLRNKLVQQFGVSRLGASDRSVIRRVLKRGQIQELEEYYQVKDFVDCVDNIEIVGEENYEALDAMLHNYDGPGETEPGEESAEAEKPGGDAAWVSIHRARIPRPAFDFVMVDDEKLFPPATPKSTLEAFLEAKFDLIASCFEAEWDRTSFLHTKRSAMNQIHSPTNRDLREACAFAEHEAEAASWRLVGGAQQRRIEEELKERFGFRRIGPSAQARVAHTLAANERGDSSDRMIVDRFLHAHPHQTLFPAGEVKRVRALLKSPTAREKEQAAAAEKASRRPKPALPADLGGMCLGAVFVRDSRGDGLEERVIAFDERRVLSESRYAGDSDWSARSKRGRVAYRGCDTAWFLHEARLVRIDKPTTVDLARHRPDLPLRFGESRQVEWEKRTFESREHFAVWLRGKDAQLLDQPPLRAPRVALVPLTETSLGKALVVDADSETGVSALELFWQAHLAWQSTRQRGTTRGVGFYRFGLEKGDVPSYFVGGLREAADGW